MRLPFLVLLCAVACQSRREDERPPPLDEEKYPERSLQVCAEQLMRFPGMHAPADEVISVSPTTTVTGGDYPEGMGPMYALHAAGFIATEVPDIQITPHGYPKNIALRIRPVGFEPEAAGEPCASR